MLNALFARVFKFRTPTNQNGLKLLLIGLYFVNDILRNLNNHFRYTSRIIEIGITNEVQTATKWWGEMIVRGLQFRTARILQVLRKRVYHYSTRFIKLVKVCQLNINMGLPVLVSNTILPHTNAAWGYYYSKII